MRYFFLFLLAGALVSFEAEGGGGGGGGAGGSGGGAGGTGSGTGGGRGGAAPGAPGGPTTPTPPGTPVVPSQTTPLPNTPVSPAVRGTNTLTPTGRLGATNQGLITTNINGIPQTNLWPLFSNWLGTSFVVNGTNIVPAISNWLATGMNPSNAPPGFGGNTIISQGSNWPLLSNFLTTNVSGTNTLIGTNLTPQMSNMIASNFPGIFNMPATNGGRF